MADSDFEFGTTPFYVLRHGETRESRDGILQGQSETELNAVGRKMAEGAAQSLSGVKLGSIYSSPLKRAWRTAFVVSVLTRVPVYPLPGLMERDWGGYEGMPKDQRPSSPNPEGAESLEEFTRRIVQAIESVPGPSPVLFVTHSGVFRIICQHIGIAMDRRISVQSGLVLRFDPPSGQRPKWRISVV
ncbi:MAG: histidine phosphatase family protein [Kiloniellales bacterium]|nr:histidine phosphatase family protein [Kiloniellales bacterium]